MGFLERNISSAAQVLERTIAGEACCRERGVLQGVDARLKLAGFAGIVLACSLARSITALLCLYAAGTALACLSKISLKEYTKRVWIFVPAFTAFVAIPALFLTPGTRVASIGPFWITHEGARTASMLVLRVSASVSYSILFVLTTPWSSIVRALRAFRLPGIVVTIVALCYRYLLLLLRALAELFIARRSRVIEAFPFRKEAAFVSRSAAYLFMKSLHLAEGVHMALVSRGWDDDGSIGPPVCPAAGPPVDQTAMSSNPTEPDGSPADRDASSDARRGTAGCSFELRSVRYEYPGNLHGLSVEDLRIPRARCSVLLGPNGSGKSTLLKVLGGLVFPQSGSTRFCGQELSERAFEDRAFRRFFRSTVGLVFQDADVQCFSPTVREELAFGPLQMGLDGREVERRVEAALAALGISSIADRYPYNLSGGEKKRVALASILTMDLDVYLLDEPTANLDPATEGVLIDILSGLSGYGKTLVIATQDLMLARHIADFAIVMGAEKRLLFAGAADDALENATLLESAGLVHGHKHPHRQTPAGLRHTHYIEEKGS